MKDQHKQSDNYRRYFITLLSLWCIPATMPSRNPPPPESIRFSIDNCVPIFRVSGLTRSKFSLPSLFVYSHLDLTNAVNILTVYPSEDR